MFKRSIALSALFLLTAVSSPSYAKTIYNPAPLATPTPIVTPQSTPVSASPAFSVYLPFVQNNYSGISTPLAARSASQNSPEPSQTPFPASASKVEESFGQKNVPFSPWSIKGVNYFNQNHTWERMWQQYDSVQIEKDLDLARGINANTFRIFIPHHMFGGTSLDQNMVSHVRDFLDSAYSRNIDVIVTLLDGEKDFCVLDKAYAAEHAQKIATALNDHPAILLYDLKNEPNCSGRLTDDLVMKLHYVSDAVRAVSSIPQTVGLLEGDVERIAQVRDFVDVVQIHHYWTQDTLDSLLLRAISLSGETPLFLGEFGKPVRYYNKSVLEFLTVDEQAAYFESALATAKKRNIAGVLVWTLFDFNDVDPQAHPGNIDQFGIFDVQRNPRPAAEIIKREYE